MRLCYFDGSKEYGHFGAKNLCTLEHQELAVEAVREGVVLLKNDGSLSSLPPTQCKSNDN